MMARCAFSVLMAAPSTVSPPSARDRCATGSNCRRLTTSEAYTSIRKRPQHVGVERRWTTGLRSRSCSSTPGERPAFPRKSVDSAVLRGVPHDHPSLVHPSPACPKLTGTVPRRCISAHASTACSVAIPPGRPLHHLRKPLPHCPGAPVSRYGFRQMSLACVARRRGNRKPTAKGISTWRKPSPLRCGAGAMEERFRSSWTPPRAPSVSERMSQHSSKERARNKEELDEVIGRSRQHDNSRNEPIWARIGGIPYEVDCSVEDVLLSQEGDESGLQVPWGPLDQ
jgi:hypothetical protein